MSSMPEYSKNTHTYKHPNTQTSKYANIQTWKYFFNQLREPTNPSD